MISQAEKPGDCTVITVNCPDKTGLGCDLCRIILPFGLSISRGGNQSFFVGFGFVSVLLSNIYVNCGGFQVCFEIVIMGSEVWRNS